MLLREQSNIGRFEARASKKGECFPGPNLSLPVAFSHLSTPFFLHKPISLSLLTTLHILSNAIHSENLRTTT